MIFDAIDSMPNYRRVTLAIEEQIVNGRMKLGDALPTEQELAEQLGVNRSTLREGLRALETSGFVKRAGGKKLVVCAPDSHDVAQYTSRALALQSITFRELWEMMMALEPLAARFAATRASDDMLSALQDNVAATEARLHDDGAIIRLDVEFHGLIAKASGNRALALSEEPLGMLLYASTRRLYRSSPRARYRLLEAHRKIAQGLVRRDAETAETWMRKHIEDFRRGYVVAGLDVNGPVRSSSLDAVAARLGAG